MFNIFRILFLALKKVQMFKIIFQVSVFKKKKLKGELALAYESYTGGIIIVILIEIRSGYCFILY